MHHLTEELLQSRVGCLGVRNGSGINITTSSTVFCLQFWKRIVHAQGLLQSMYSSIIIGALGLFPVDEASICSLGVILSY